MRKLIGGASAFALVLGLGMGLSAPAWADGGGGPPNNHPPRGGGGAQIKGLDIKLNCGNCDVRVEARSISAGATAVNAEEQDIRNSTRADDDVVESSSVINATNNFGSHTFERQKLNVNNFNTGINAAQQGGIAIAADLANEGAVSINALKQIVTNRVAVGHNVVEASYNGTMEFGNFTFQNQKVNVNNFNSGMNAAQQGAIAIAVNTNGFGHDN